MRPASQRSFIHSCIYLRILILSYLATFLGTNSLSVLMCRKAVNQSINLEDAKCNCIEHTHTHTHTYLYIYIYIYIFIQQCLLSMPLTKSLTHGSVPCLFEKHIWYEHAFCINCNLPQCAGAWHVSVVHSALSATIAF